MLHPQLPHTHGHVTLVGAGPGDPELLTLKAVRAIQGADVIFVDDLVNPLILQHATPHARVVHVGKRGGCQSTPQAFIEKSMVQAAREGLRVVRLKGGDPFMFGRGGEEIETLREQGITCDVVSGITAGVAAMSALSTPLTHRGLAQGVLFITGHSQQGSDGPDWASLGHMAHTQRITLVIYMAMTQLEQITQQLLNSMPADTAVAIVQHATLPEQRHAACSLSQVAHLAAAEGLGSPAVWVIGDVTRGLQALNPALAQAA